MNDKSGKRPPRSGGGPGGANRRERTPPHGAPRGPKPPGRKSGKPGPGKGPVRVEAGGPGESERIAKRLARAGLASRRDAEEMIAAGRVTLNGRVLSSPAVNVSMADRIEVDGRPIPAIERTRLFLFHKPEGTVTTNRDPQGRKTVFDVLPAELPRLMSVGRLDIATEGLLLLTNDGGLARVLELPSTGWLRRYRVRVHGKVDEAALEGLKEGIAIEGVYYGAVEATLDRVQGSNAWLTIGLREGKNREVRNILSALGLDVTRLIRVSYGPFQLADLAEGEIREIKGSALREQLGPRLIEQAGANFEAPVLNPFSAKDGSAGQGGPKRQAGNRGRDDKSSSPRPAGSGSPRPAGARSKAPPPRDRDRRDGKPGPGGAKPAKPGPAQQRSRATHVWMAPGARPLGEKKAAEKAEQNEGRRYAGKPKPRSPRKPRRDG